MAATPRNLAEYVQPGDQSRVLVEHARCGNRLGVHATFWDSSFDPPLVVLDRDTSPHGRVYNMAPALPGDRGKLTAPGVHIYATPGDWSPGPPSHHGAPHVFGRVQCSCLPADHVEKLGVEKLGALPVTFPKWKWGRAIDLPVVTI